jgi:hypothetical protein
MSFMCATLRAALLFCVSALPLVSTSSTRRIEAYQFTGYPPSVYMNFFQPCSPDATCTKKDVFRIDPIPQGCCDLLVTNGDGQGKDEVHSYEVFFNDERYIQPTNARSSGARVKAQKLNNIRVRLSGETGSKIMVLLTYNPSKQ